MSVETFIPSTTVISLTDSAVKHFEKKVASRPGSVIRLSTKVSGCTGYAYVLDLADAPEADDELVSASNALTVAVAKDAVKFVRNTEIDYVQEGINGVIKYNNPNVVDECGCGESFNIGQYVLAKAQKMVVTERDCKARLVPAGQISTIPGGEFVSITQELGGNYTITWRGNMYRIDGTDADAIGRKPMVLNFDAPADGNIDEQQVWDALETIYDPEIPINLVSLGLIYKVSVDQDKKSVAVDMTLTAPGCGMGPVLVGDVEYRIGMVPHVDSVHVELVFDPPWSRDKMSEEAQLEAGLFF